MNTFIQWQETISDAYLTYTPSYFPFIKRNTFLLPQGSLASIPSNALIFSPLPDQIKSTVHQTWPLSQTSPFLEVVLLCAFRHVDMWTASTWRDGSSTGHPREVASKKGSRLCRRLIEKSDFVSQPSISYRLYTKFRPPLIPLIFVRAIRTSVRFTNIELPAVSVCRVHFETNITGGPAVFVTRN